MASFLSLLRKKFVIGTTTVDALTGTDQGEVLVGFGGPDTIDAAGGNDVVSGGGGDDFLVGGDGNDWIYGGGDNDTIYGDGVAAGSGFGDDFIDGGSGNDTIYATWQGIGNSGIGGPNRIDGGSGNDIIFGEQSADLLIGGTGDDTIVGYEGDDVIRGGTGNDDLTWGNALAPSGVGTLEGGDGNDILRGSFATPNMDGGNGDDTLILGRFNPGVPSVQPNLQGGAGFDTLNISIRPSFDLTGADAQNVGGIERIDLTGGAPTGQDLILNMASLLNLSNTTDTLRVDGDVGDRVTAQGAWFASSTQTIDGILYNQWISSSASLLVESDLSFSIA